MSDKFSTFIQSEIDRINIHLPVKVVNLRVAMKMEKPGVTLRDGFFHEFNEKELKYIKERIPQVYWGHVLLPIMITRRRDLGPSDYIVGGSEPNLYLVKSVFEELPIYDVWRMDQEKKFLIYRHELKEVRKKLSTTSIIAFS